MKAEKVYDQTFTARNFNTSPLTISGLKGDTYNYELWVVQSVHGQVLEMTLNSDSTANYREYYLRGNNSAATAAVNDAQAYFIVGFYGDTGTYNSLSKTTITGSSGDERYLDCLNGYYYSAVGTYIDNRSGYWKNTADEVTSLTLAASSSNNSSAHIILYRTPKEASQEKWEFIKKGSQTSAGLYPTLSPITISSLNGDQDGIYKLVINTKNVSANCSAYIEINSDTTAANYTNQYLYNASGTIAAYNAVYAGALPDANASATDQTIEYIINAETGQKRLIQMKSSRVSGNSQQSESVCWWANTASNLSTIRIVDAYTSNNYNTEWKLYRKRNPKTIGDTLPFEMVEEESFSSADWSAGSTYTVSGDDVLLYKIEGLLSNASGDIEIRMELNSDTAANYPEQLLKGDTSTASAASTTRNYIVLAKLQNGDQAEFNHYLYPKSGENRPMLTECSYDENALEKLAHWWNNSADSINSIKIYASSTNAITGTLKLSRLYKGLRKQVNTFGFGASKGAYTADSTDFQMTTMSATAWVYLNSGYNTDGAIQGQFGASGNRSWYYRVTSSKAITALFCSDGTTIAAANSMTTTTTLNTEQWYMLTFVLDGSNCYMYINDSQDTSKAYSSGLYNSTNNFEIGYLSNYAGYVFDGDITGVRVYKNTALTADDVSQLYNNGIVRKYSSLPTGLQGTAAWELTDRDNTGNDLGSTNNLTFVGSTTDDGVSILYNK